MLFITRTCIIAEDGRTIFCCYWN